MPEYQEDWLSEETPAKAPVNNRGRTFEYKAIPVVPGGGGGNVVHVIKEVVSYFQSVLDANTVDGWEFIRVDRVTLHGGTHLNVPDWNDALGQHSLTIDVATFRRPVQAKGERK